MKNLSKQEQSNSRFTPAERKNFRPGLKDFAAIDFEMANNKRSSVCSVGIVITLIQPEPNY